MNNKERRKSERAALGLASDALIMEMNQGKWDHIPNLNNIPITQIIEINEELEKRCPGYEKEQYQESIARSIINNR